MLLRCAEVFVNLSVYKADSGTSARIVSSLQLIAVASSRPTRDRRLRYGEAGYIFKLNTVMRLHEDQSVQFERCHLEISHVNRQTKY